MGEITSKVNWKKHKKKERQKDKQMDRQIDRKQKHSTLSPPYSLFRCITDWTYSYSMDKREAPQTYRTLQGIKVPQ